METSVKRVYVQVVDNGKTKVLPCPIRTNDGQLMTQRLKRLLSGRYQWNYGVWCDPQDEANVFVNHDVQSVGLVWRKPYTLLEEIARNRLELQHELYMLEGSSELTRATPILVLPDSTDFEISGIVWRELMLRGEIKRRIRELGDIKSRQARSREYHGGYDDGRGGGWMQP